MALLQDGHYIHRLTETLCQCFKIVTFCSSGSQYIVLSPQRKTVIICIFFSHAVFRNLTPLPDEKEFDVFLSYVWSPASEEVLGGEIISSRSPLNDEEGKPKQGFFFHPITFLKNIK